MIVRKPRLFSLARVVAMTEVSDDGFVSDQGSAGNSPKQNRENNVEISENEVG